jgi:replication factor C subunit 3/5
MMVDAADNGVADPVADSRREEAQKTLPWIEKYRPSSLHDLIAHDEIVRTLDKLAEGGNMPHLLLYGPPGTGKTSTVLALARKLHGESYKSTTLELNASDDRTISMVRDQIKDFASTKKMGQSGLKLIILDEADAITQEAQAALRRIMEKYSKNARFCLMCNHVNKIIPAIQSRCTRFRFGPLAESQVRTRLEEIIAMEGVRITEDGIKAVLQLGGGDMRRNLNILQAAHMAFPDKIDEEAVYSCTGNPLPSDIRSMVECMLAMDVATCFNKISTLKTEKGYALQDILTSVHSILVRLKIDNSSRISLYKALADIENRLAAGANEKLQLSAMISAFILVRANMDKVQS